MAVKQFVPAKKVQKHSVILFLVVFSFVCLAVAGCVVNYSRAADNNAQVSQMSEECEEIKNENEELKRFLENKNHDEYYEKIAREQYGYAKPGERVFYDSSFGN